MATFATLLPTALGVVKTFQKSKESAQDAALKRQQNLLGFQNAETDRLTKLRQSIATQRANFGAQGVGSGAGSSETVLTAITEKSDIDRQKNAAAYGLSDANITHNLDSQKQINLLQQTQLLQSAAVNAVK